METSLGLFAILLAAPGTVSQWGLGLSMGVLVFGGLLLYGAGAAMLGRPVTAPGGRSRCLR